MWLYMIAVLGYFGVLAAIAVWRSRVETRTATGDDFLIAGRSLPAYVLSFTMLSTWIGSGSLFGGAGLGYRIGVAALWQSAGAWVGIALVFFIVPRVRRLAQYTVPDILDLRYGAPARIAATITIVLGYTAIAAYQFRGGGRLLNLAAGIDANVGAILTAAFCVFVTALGGMRSVARLDVVNAVTMVAGFAVALIYLLGAAGGAAGASASLRADQLTMFGSLSPREAAGLFLPTLCLLLGDASMYQKFSSARDEPTARLGVAGWIIATIVVETLIIAVAALGSLTAPGLSVADSEGIVVRIAVGVLPMLLGALLLAAAAAIVVSTANSMLLAPASNLVRDLYQRFVNRTAGDRQIVLLMRVAIAGLGLAGLLAGILFPTVLAMALWVYSMYGAGITPALLAALLWPRVTREAGLYSIAAGMAVTLLLELVAAARGSVAAPAYLLGVQTIYPALAASVGTLVGVTLRSARL